MAILIGLTGGIGSGKTLAASMFQNLGVHIIDADRICRDLVEPGKPAWDEIRSVFGDRILSPDQTLDRKKLATIVFDDDSNRQKLENILHPKVFQEESRRYEEIRKAEPKAIVVIDAALLIESGNHGRVMKVIVVRCSEEIQIQRMMACRSMPEKEVKNRIRKQMPLEEKIKYADFILDNDSDVESLRAQVTDLYQKLKALAESGIGKS